MKAVSVQAIGLTFLCSVVTAQHEGAAWGSVLKVGDEFTFKEGLHKGVGLTFAICSIMVAKLEFALAST